MSSAASSQSRVYCTYFDSHYLARGIVMLRSLLLHDSTAEIHVLAFDECCGYILRRIFEGRIRIVYPDAIHARFPVLRDLRDARSRWAYYATVKPALVQLLLAKRPPSVTFLDADTWFFSDTAPLYREIAEASIAVSPHRFSAAMSHAAVYGRFNAGCIYWRGDDIGRQCAADWGRACIEWCDEDLPGDGRYMNQGYLNEWPVRYSGVHVIGHAGVNLAPWNYAECRLESGDDGVTVDGLPLIFYHFSGLLRDDEARWWYLYYPHEGPAFEFLRGTIYRPYLRAVETEIRMLRQSYDVETTGSIRSGTVDAEAVRLYPGDAD